MSDSLQLLERCSSVDSPPRSVSSATSCSSGTSRTCGTCGTFGAGAGMIAATMRLVTIITKKISWTEVGECLCAGESAPLVPEPADVDVYAVVIC